MKQWSKCQNVLKDAGESKADRLEDAAAAVDTSDGESSMSDCSEVSHTQASQSGQEAVPC